MAKKAEKKFVLARTPIVAVMGHVDHGKTSLLDAIRGTKVTEGEVGGITQNTRAHQITYQGNKITFVDTPGHEAFSNMRSRGAKVTDMVLLVVAADDGVQPQTKESIDFAKAEKVPVLVAINKIDLPNKDIEKVKRELTQAGLNLEEYGGDTMVVEVSALKKTGLDDLLDHVLLLAEVSELKKSDTKDFKATAFVLESTRDERLGPASLLIVKAGTIKKGDYVVSEDSVAKVRSILDEFQKPIENAEQGDPAWIIGMNEVVKSGSILGFTTEEKTAKTLLKKETTQEIISEEKAETEEPKEEQDDSSLLAELIGDKTAEEDIRYLNLVLKTATQGTLEAVLEQMKDLDDENVKIRVLESATGAITEKDVLRAKNAGGIVIGFQVELGKHVLEIAQKERVLVKNYEIIYELLDEVADFMDSLVEPSFVEVEIARAKVKKTFTLSNGQVVAGSEVTKGTFTKGFRVYVEREGERQGEGKISSLRKLKSEVKEVKKGEECGILIEPQVDVQEGDEIVCFKTEKA